MGNVLIASLSGLGIGYALARFTDRLWPRSRLVDDPRTEVRDSLPLIAVGLALMFAVHSQQHAFGVVFIKSCVFSAAMFLVDRVNRRTLSVPNIITIPGTVLGLFLSVFTPPGAASALIGALGGGGALFLLAATGGLGMGIVKLQALIGAFLGWELAAVTFMLGATAGGVGAGLGVHGRGPQARLPYGSYIALSAVIAAPFGRAILNWFAS